MKLSDVKRMCKGYTAVCEMASAHPSNVLSYKVDGKKFAYFKTSEPEQWRFSIRVSPERFIELTDQPNVKPARYMHRFHWVSIVNVEAFNSTYLSELVEWSYRKAGSSLTKKRQKELGLLL